MFFRVLEVIKLNVKFGCRMLRIKWNLNGYFNISVILETLFNYMFIKVIRIGNKILCVENVFLLYLVLMLDTLRCYCRNSLLGAHFRKTNKY